MPIPVKEIYEDVALDSANTSENGQLGFQMFNRLSKRAELRMLDYLTSDIANQIPPILGNSQKNTDWISFLITPFPAQVINGAITRPADYYGYDSMVLLGNYQGLKNCDDTEENEDEETAVVTGCNTTIQLLGSAQFALRCTSFVEGLKPSFTNPIAKQVGRTFEFMPTDMGSVKLQYVRYPIFAKIVAKPDPIYNDEVIDEDASTNYEYDDSARQLLIYWITQEYGIHTREQALLQANQLEGKTAG